MLCHVWKLPPEVLKICIVHASANRNPGVDYKFAFNNSTAKMHVVHSTV